MTISEIVEKVKILLNIEDTTLYDDRLEIYVGAAISKLQNEGIYNIYDLSSSDSELVLAYDYLTCVSYQVALDLDMVQDFNRLYTQYITRVVTLRAAQQ